MPRSEVSKLRLFPYGVDLDASGAIVRFTDASGVRWLRRPNGNLDELPGPAAA